MIPLAPALTLALALAAGTAAAPAAPARPQDRSQIPEKYRWRLTDLFPSDAAWTEARQAFERDLPAFARHRGHLGDSARALADALTDMAALQLRLERLVVYAKSRTDEDTRLPGPRAMSAEAERLAVRLDAATSWVRPEILTLPTDTIRRYQAEDRRLQEFSFYLDDAIRWKPHTLSADEERIVAMTGDLAGAGRNLHTVLTNADLPYPTVTLSSGEQVRLDPSGYVRARSAPDRAGREKVFQAFFGALKQYERTVGAALFAQVKAHMFEKDVHRFPASLDSALFFDNIPVKVYTQLLADVHQHLPTLHRYLRLRQRMLGLPSLGYEDLYAPLVKDVDRTYDVDQAVAMTLAAVAPLGKAYQDQLKRGLETGWTDFYPTPGKQNGAYSTGVYGVHPFQLLNFNGQWEDVSTLAHEAGHSMHTLLAYESQPYWKSGYSIFVAEVASTLNENLLFHQALAQARTDPERLALLGRHLESLRTTLFRQTMFAEFELAYHEAAEKGAALTGERLSELYLGIVRRYYGHDQGVCNVAELYGDEWTYVHHFFTYRFYVYQYATSLVASTALAKAIREDAAHGRTAARDRFLGLLRSGGSDYPVEQLKRAGVDLTTSAPFQAAIQDMNATMDQIDRILAKQPRK